MNENSKTISKEMITSDGWATSYYALPPNARELQDLIEFKGMNFSVGNIFKAAYRLGSKSGSDELYDLNKIIWFATREKDRVESLLARERNPIDKGIG